MSGPARDRTLLRPAIEMGNEWLRHGLSTLPAERTTAEAAVTGLYRLIGQDPPRFLWVESPRAAMAAIPEEQRRFRLRADELPARGGDWPVASLLATLVSDLRAWLDKAIGSAWSQPSPRQDDLDGGARDRLRSLLRDAVLQPLRTSLTATGDALGVAWYGQHDAYWVAHYDIRRRLGLARYRPAEDHQLDLWAMLARSAGWWWPYDGLCVMSERPVAVHTELNDLRLHSADGPAVAYADGWRLFSWHGTRVPAWVVQGPTAERIADEHNVEVRRCAIERLGWDVYMDQAGLDLLAEAPDPGNPGCRLRLYEVPGRGWGPVRLLLAVNGSLERDGRRRRYGLGVPARFNDPVAAAGWTYGLTGAQYTRLARRT